MSRGRERPAAAHSGAEFEKLAGHLDTAESTSHRRQPLSSTAVELIRDGGENGSRVAWHIALHLRNGGYSFADYRAVMTDPLNSCSRWYRDLRDGRTATAGKHRKSGRGEARALKELERAWVKVARLPDPRRQEPADIHERASRVLREADRLLSGPTRATRMKVLVAVCGEAVHYGTSRVLCPTRNVALAAGVTRSTAGRALRDLAAIGLLRRVDANTTATVFELTTCSTRNGTDFPHTRREESVLHLVQGVELDVWRHRDLGASGLLIHDRLRDGEQWNVTALAASTGLHRNTVRKRLRQLRSRGLAVEVESRQWRVGTVDPAKVLGPARGNSPPPR